MTEASFSQQVRNELSGVQNLTQVGERLTQLAHGIKSRGRRLGMVVGRISPLDGEPPSVKFENKRRLADQTEQIARLPGMDGVDIFSSADIPDELEGFPPAEFYAVLEDFVRTHVRVLITTEGWEQSRGANAEVRIARERRLDLYHFVEDQLRPDTAHK